LQNVSVAVVVVVVVVNMKFFKKGIQWLVHTCLW
jgi:hypothetical protein